MMIMKGGTKDMESCYVDCDSSNCGRMFLTKEEKIQKLKRYKETLDLESKAVGERLAELQDEEE